MLEDNNNNGATHIMAKRKTSYTKRYGRRAGRKAKRMATSTHYLLLGTGLLIIAIVAF